MIEVLNHYVLDLLFAGNLCILSNVDDKTTLSDGYLLGYGLSIISILRDMKIYQKFALVYSR